jgi:UDP-glucuronate decarboxylase
LRLRCFLVIGGFLGSHLCERLLEEGHDVPCVDNFFTGRKRASRISSATRVRADAHDIAFLLYVEVDGIDNLAAGLPDPLTARSGADDQDPRARRHQHARPRQAHQRQDPAGLDLGSLRQPGSRSAETESDGGVNPTGIRSCYDEGKRCAETLFFDYHRQHGVPIKIARSTLTVRACGRTTAA